MTDNAVRGCKTDNMASAEMKKPLLLKGLCKMLTGQGRDNNETRSDEILSVVIFVVKFTNGKRRNPFRPVFGQLPVSRLEYGAVNEETFQCQAIKFFS